MNSNSLAWIKPALFGACAGAVALAVVGFHWGGWVTGDGARSMAESQSQDAVVVALTPICLDLAKRDPDFAAKLADLKKASSYGRGEEIVKAGWGTTLGTEATNKLVARACADKLVL
ncbi:hypothetical protein [Labrys wisconsinensis]|uniref:Uncharacterized protein n=1 Tax=Labrys wisconsinensis TaxID=425677 RepID=A0ABU0JBL6_9HYPH|nr:hypothetical protein [Labrys wisconsinensis]MDQ0471664.1 hypothetical protein [Labrys wisconsinensis]